MNQIVSVITPADSVALTTLERLKLELGITSDINDDLLLARINSVSSLIARRCFSAFGLQTVIETFYVDWNDRCFDRLILDRSPVRNIDSVTVDGIALADEVIVDDVVTDFAEWLLDGEQRRLYRQTTAGSRIDWSFSTSAAVQYTGGYVLPGQAGRDLPFEIEDACVELAVSYWLSRGRDPGLRAEEAPGVFRFEYQTTATGYDYGLPPSVMNKLDPYLRKDMVL